MEIHISVNTYLYMYVNTAIRQYNNISIHI